MLFWPPQFGGTCLMRLYFRGVRETQTRVDSSATIYERIKGGKKFHCGKKKGILRKREKYRIIYEQKHPYTCEND